MPGAVGMRLFGRLRVELGWAEALEAACALFCLAAVLLLPLLC